MGRGQGGLRRSLSSRLSSEVFDGILVSLQACSVVRDCVQQLVRMPLLLSGEDFVHLAVQVPRGLDLRKS